VTISLVRVEQTPSGQQLRPCRETIATPVSSATDATTAHARFELNIPADAVPSGRGAQCSLSYALLARSHDRGVPVNAWAAVEVVARGEAHMKPRVDPGTMMLDVGCTEAWRSRPSWRGAPAQWNERVMWAATAPVQLDADRGWAPFRCEIPAGLPAATEADTLAWRHDLAVSRRLRHRPDQHATLTPLLFETT
jgi:hypothetical protein